MVFISLILVLLIAPSVMAADASEVWEGIKKGISKTFEFIGEWTSTLTLNPEDNATVGFIRVCFFIMALAIIHAGTTRVFQNQEINQGALIAISVIMATIGTAMVPAKIIIAGSGIFAVLIAWGATVGIHIAIMYFMWDWELEGWSPGAMIFVKSFAYLTFLILLIFVYQSLHIEWAWFIDAG
ncbi:hypothetical protein J4410_00380 [Candidatus Woesearchaeota archaeon]|nr:hypothetical protein [Candidatus Woesearchaeota archaeon]